MRHLALRSAIREARLRKGLSQAALAAASGTGRVTIIRLEGGAEQDCRLGTLGRICAALGLELAASAIGTSATGDAAPERDRARRLDDRRRHAALAAALLALPADKAAGLVDQARATVDRWARDRTTTEPHIARWRERLDGPVRTVALRLLEHGEWTESLLRDTPWSFALEPAA